MRDGGRREVVVICECSQVADRKWAGLVPEVFLLHQSNKCNDVNISRFTMIDGDVTVAPSTHD